MSGGNQIELSAEEERLIKTRREDQEREAATTALRDALERNKTEGEQRLKALQKAHEEEQTTKALHELEQACSLGKVPEKVITRFFNAQFGAGTAALELPQLSRFERLHAIVVATKKDRERADVEAEDARRKQYAREAEAAEDRRAGEIARQNAGPIDYTR